MTLTTAALQEEETDVGDAILPSSVIAEVLVLVILLNLECLFQRT